MGCGVLFTMPLLMYQEACMQGERYTGWCCPNDLRHERYNLEEEQARLHRGIQRESDWADRSLGRPGRKPG